MIVDALVQTEAVRQPIARREIDSGGSLGLCRCLDVLETRIHISRLAVCRDGFPSIATPTTVSHTPVATIFWQRSALIRMRSGTETTLIASSNFGPALLYIAVDLGVCPLYCSSRSNTGRGTAPCRNALSWNSLRLNAAPCLDW